MFLKQILSSAEIGLIIDSFFFYYGIHKYQVFPGHAFENLKFQEFSKNKKLLYILTSIISPYLSKKITGSNSKKRIMNVLKKLNSFCIKIYNIIELIFFLKFLKNGTHYGISLISRSDSLYLLNQIYTNRQKWDAISGQ